MQVAVALPQSFPSGCFIHRPQAKDPRAIVCTRLGKDGRPHKEDDRQEAVAGEPPVSTSVPTREDRLAASRERVMESASLFQTLLSSTSPQDAVSDRVLGTEYVESHPAGGDPEISGDGFWGSSWLDGMEEESFKGTDDSGMGGEGLDYELVSPGAGGEAGLISRRNQRSSGLEDEEGMRLVKEIKDAISRAQTGLSELPEDERRGALMAALRANFPNLDLVLGGEEEDVVEEEDGDEDGQDFVYGLDEDDASGSSGPYRYVHPREYESDSQGGSDSDGSPVKGKDTVSDGRDEHRDEL